MNPTIQVLGNFFIFTEYSEVAKNSTYMFSRFRTTINSAWIMQALYHEIIFPRYLKFAQSYESEKCICNENNSFISPR